RRWTMTGPLNVARRGAAAVVLPSGQVLITGGVAAPILSSSELYDPAGGRWTPTAPMGVTRLDNTLMLLPDGKVLATGGTTTDGPAGPARVRPSFPRPPPRSTTRRLVAGRPPAP
ncbi:MAG: kelch motif-containing protein, partial [Actinomycetota bacterium]|nr:kelch motif-containing protein [Actinomycetota bacterium]